MFSVVRLQSGSAPVALSVGVQGEGLSNLLSKTLYLATSVQERAATGNLTSYYRVVWLVFEGVPWCMRSRGGNGETSITRITIVSIY